MIGVNAYDGEAYVGSDLDTISKPQSSKPISTCPPQRKFVLNRAQAIADCNPHLCVHLFAGERNPIAFRRVEFKRPRRITGSPQI